MSPCSGALGTMAEPSTGEYKDQLGPHVLGLCLLDSRGIGKRLQLRPIQAEYHRWSPSHILWKLVGESGDKQINLEGTQLSVDHLKDFGAKLPVRSVFHYPRFLVCEFPC